MDIFPDLAGLALVFEYMPHTLYSKMKDHSNPLDRETIRKFFKMLLDGLKYMHGIGIMHRVKCFNLK